MKTPSVQLKPSRQPCARAHAASSRTVVVLPFEPVTSATGTSCSVGHGTCATVWQRVRAARCAPPSPEPSVSASSSRTRQTLRERRPRASARRRGDASSCDSRSNRASAARSSSTGGAAANATGNGVGAVASAGSRASVRRALRCADQCLLECRPADRRRVDERRAERPLVDLGGGEQLVAAAPRPRATRPSRAAERDDRARASGQSPCSRAHSRDRVAAPGRPATRSSTSTPTVLEHGAGRSEEQVAARQAPRVVERQCGRLVQSSTSGARRMPRSSRSRPSRLVSGGGSTLRAR